MFGGLRSRARRLGTIGAIVAVSIGGLAVPAGASPPQANGESFSFEGAIAFDALANDSSVSGALVVAGNTQPAHGTATCAPMGGCLYTATAGYTGPDAFTYTVSDGVENAPATVSLNVTALPPGPLVAVDDSLGVAADSTASVNVLANDTGGDGTRTLVSNTQPAHGTVVCAVEGGCLYTPNAGYAGTDGFLYSAVSGQVQKSAAVHVTVAPSGASFSLSAQGSPATDGGSWQVGAVPHNVPQEAAAAVGVPGVKGTPNAPEVLAAGSTTTAASWVAGADGSSASAAADALVGDSLGALFPPPLPPISQGTGGDGHVPIIVGSEVFGFYHHSDPTSITCVDRLTGALCPGYPKRINLSTNDYMPGPSVVVGSKIWTHLDAASFYEQSASVSLFCWDAATDQTCGLTVVDRIQTQNQPQVSAPRLVAGKAWFGGEPGQLYCVDPVTGAVCGPIATGMGTAITFHGGQLWDEVAHGNRVYLSRSSDRMVGCIDVVARGICTGWGTMPTFPSHDLITRYSASGVADGVCGSSGSSLVCVPDGDPTAAETLSGWVGRDIHYSFTSEAETGPRTLYGGLDLTGMACYDWTTRAACTGGQYVGGVVSVDRNGAPLPRRGAYGAAFDGACVVGLGDNGQVYTVDPSGTSPCTSLATGASGKVVDLRAQRCDGTVGNATWGKATLVDVDLTAGEGDFASLVLTVKDADTGAALFSQDMVGTNGVVDLSTFSAAAHPSLVVGATAVTRSGTTAWDDGIWPQAIISWHADASDVCFRTSAPPPCPPAIASIVAAFLDGRNATTVAVAVDRPAVCVLGTIFNRDGYLMVAEDGGVFASDPTSFFGDSNFLGAASAGGGGVHALRHVFGPPFLAPQSLHVLNAPIVDAAMTPTRNGYVLAGADGGAFTFGDAPFSGSLGNLHLNAPITGVALDPDGTGYWMVASDGGVFAFDAPFLGSMGAVRLSAPVVAMAATPSGHGYWLVAADGGIFTFGDATFAGSLGALKLNKPIVGMALDKDGSGYYLAASDGGVFAFDAPFFGSEGGTPINAPVVGIVRDPDGSGYWLGAEDGGVFSFDAPFLGSVSHLDLNQPIRTIVGT